MTISVFFALWATCSLSMPASHNDVSYLTGGPDGYDVAEKLNARSSSSRLSNLVPSTGAEDQRKAIDHDPLAQAKANLESRRPDNTTQDEQTAAGDQVITFADNIAFRTSCNKGNGAILSMEDIFTPVGDVIADLSKGIYPMSTKWGVDLLSNDDITVWLHVDIMEGEPLVNTVLIRNMFQMVVYHQSCYIPGGTKGGSVLALRAGDWSRKLAYVSIHAVNRREVQWKIEGRM